MNAKPAIPRAARSLYRLYHNVRLQLPTPRRAVKLKIARVPSLVGSKRARTSNTDTVPTIAPARRTLWQQGGRNEHWVAPGAMYGRVARGNRMSAGKRRAMEREDRIWWQEKCVWRRRYRRRSAPCALEVTEPSSGLDRAPLGMNWDVECG